MSVLQCLKILFVRGALASYAVILLWLFFLFHWTCFLKVWPSDTKFVVYYQTLSPFSNLLFPPLCITFEYQDCVFCSWINCTHVTCISRIWHRSWLSVAWCRRDINCVVLYTVSGAWFNSQWIVSCFTFIGSMTLTAVISPCLRAESLKPTRAQCTITIHKLWWYAMTWCVWQDGVQWPVHLHFILRTGYDEHFDLIIIFSFFFQRVRTSYDYDKKKIISHSPAKVLRRCLANVILLFHFLNDQTDTCKKCVRIVRVCVRERVSERERERERRDGSVLACKRRSSLQRMLRGVRCCFFLLVR